MLTLLKRIFGLNGHRHPSDDILRQHIWPVETVMARTGYSRPQISVLRHRLGLGERRGVRVYFSDEEIALLQRLRRARGTGYRRRRRAIIRKWKTRKPGAS